MPAKIKLPKGWHRGKPRAKSGIYATSREACVKDGKVYGNGYAEWKNGKWYKYERWGNHFTCDDFIWKRDSP